MARVLVAQTDLTRTFIIISGIIPPDLTLPQSSLKETVSLEAVSFRKPNSAQHERIIPFLTRGPTYLTAGSLKETVSCETVSFREPQSTGAYATRPRRTGTQHRFTQGNRFNLKRFCSENQPRYTRRQPTPTDATPCDLIRSYLSQICSLKETASYEAASSKEPSAPSPNPLHSTRHNQTRPELIPTYPTASSLKETASCEAASFREPELNSPLLTAPYPVTTHFTRQQVASRKPLLLKRFRSGNLMHQHTSSRCTRAKQT